LNKALSTSDTDLSKIIENKPSPKLVSWNQCVKQLLDVIKALPHGRILRGGAHLPWDRVALLPRTKGRFPLRKMWLADTNFLSEKNVEVENFQLLTMIFSEHFLSMEIFLEWKWAFMHLTWNVMHLPLGKFHYDGRG
jgi:hypothetical protein